MRAFMLTCSFIVVIIVSCSKGGGDTTPPPPGPGLPAPPSTLGLDAFYKKYVDAGGVPIVSSGKVPDEALLKAKEIVLHMLKLLPDAKTKMIANKIRVGIIALSEKPTQMPEYRDLYTAFPGTDWDNRARAYGATMARPLTSNCEENMLCKNGDRYKGEDILTHEFAHAIHELGLRFTNPDFDNQLQAAFNNTIAKNLWANTYARSEIREYWAEGVQSWFNCNKEVSPANGVHNEINTRDELKTYDPQLYNLIKTFFADDNQKHGCY